MKTMGVLAAAALALTTAGPACAEHNGPPAREDPAARDAASVERKGSDTDLDVQIKLGKEGFRLGGRLFGRDGVAGAWLNGRIERDGLVLDGRIQEPNGRTFNFRLDADVLGLLLRRGADVLW
jgi:hypothetical protein